MSNHIRCHSCEETIQRDDPKYQKYCPLHDKMEFSLTSCPSCGDPSVPHDPEDDKTITLNVQDIRILTIWASNWQKTFMKPEDRDGLAPIMRRLRAQLAGVNLTMQDEFQQVADGFQQPIEVTELDGKVHNVLPDKKKRLN